MSAPCVTHSLPTMLTALQEVHSTVLLALTILVMLASEDLVAAGWHHAGGRHCAPVSHARDGDTAGGRGGPAAGHRAHAQQASVPASSRQPASCQLTQCDVCARNRVPQGEDDAEGTASVASALIRIVVADHTALLAFVGIVRPEGRRSPEAVCAEGSERWLIPGSAPPWHLLRRRCKPTSHPRCCHSWFLRTH